MDSYDVMFATNQRWDNLDKLPVLSYPILKEIMKYLINKIMQYERWYDRLREPMRVLIMLVIAVPFIIAMKNMRFLASQIYVIVFISYVIMRYTLQCNSRKKARVRGSNGNH